MHSARSDQATDRLTDGGRQTLPFTQSKKYFLDLGQGAPCAPSLLPSRGGAGWSVVKRRLVVKLRLAT